jgi:hypothetical protein
LNRKNLTHKTATVTKHAISKEHEKRSEDPQHNRQQEQATNWSAWPKPNHLNDSKAQTLQTSKEGEPQQTNKKKHKLHAVAH